MKNNWEKEFDEKFHCALDDYEGLSNSEYKQIKDFITNCIQEERESVLKFIDENFLAYCREQNGRPDCKNCGLPPIEELRKALNPQT